MEGFLINTCGEIDETNRGPPFLFLASEKLYGKYFNFEIPHMGQAVAFGPGVPVQMAPSSPVLFLGTHCLLTAFGIALAFFLVPIADNNISNKVKTHYVSLVEYFAFSSSDKRVNFLVVREKA